MNVDYNSCYKAEQMPSFFNACFDICRLSILQATEAEVVSLTEMFVFTMKHNYHTFLASQYLYQWLCPATNISMN